MYPVHSEYLTYVRMGAAPEILHLTTFVPVPLTFPIVPVLLYVPVLAGFSFLWGVAKFVSFRGYLSSERQIISVIHECTENVINVS